MINSNFLPTCRHDEKPDCLLMYMHAYPCNNNRVVSELGYQSVLQTDMDILRHMCGNDDVICAYLRARAEFPLTYGERVHEGK